MGFATSDGSRDPVTWTRINLAELPPREAITPTIGGGGLVYPGKRHAFSGPPESAKTLAAYATALEEVRNGGTVVLLDFEMGPWDARDRLRDLGATDAELARIPYFEPATPATTETIEAVNTRSCRRSSSSTPQPAPTPSKTSTT